MARSCPSSDGGQQAASTAVIRKPTARMTPRMRCPAATASLKRRSTTSPRLQPPPTHRHLGETDGCGLIGLIAPSAQNPMWVKRSSVRLTGPCHHHVGGAIMQPVTCVLNGIKRGCACCIKGKAACAKPQRPWLPDGSGSPDENRLRACGRTTT